MDSRVIPAFDVFKNFLPSEHYEARLKLLLRFFQDELDWLFDFAHKKAKANKKANILARHAIDIRSRLHQYQLTHFTNDDASKEFRAAIDLKIDYITNYINKIFILNNKPELCEKTKKNLLFQYPHGEPELNYYKNHIKFRASYHHHTAIKLITDLICDTKDISIRTNVINRLLSSALRDYEFIHDNKMMALVKETQEELAEILREEESSSSILNSSSTASTLRALSCSDAEPEHPSEEVWIEADAQFELHRFVMSSEAKMAIDPEIAIRKILALDLDDTMVLDKGTNTTIYFINLPKLLEMLREIPNDVAIVLITARIYPDLNGHSAEMIVNELEKMLGKQVFRSIIYTCGESKVKPMNYLFQHILAFEPNAKKSDVILYDDSLDVNIAEAEAEGFTCIHATGHDDNYTKITNITSKSDATEQDCEMNCCEENNETSNTLRK